MVAHMPLFDVFVGKCQLPDSFESTSWEVVEKRSKMEVKKKW